MAPTILSPLGAIMMPALKISPSQFAFVVSVYAFSAGTSAARLVTGLFGGVIGSIVGA